MMALAGVELETLVSEPDSLTTRPSLPSKKCVIPNFIKFKIFFGLFIIANQEFHHVAEHKAATCAKTDSARLHWWRVDGNLCIFDPITVRTPSPLTDDRNVYHLIIWAVN